jgi:hypothetical protein
MPNLRRLASHEIEDSSHTRPRSSDGGFDQKLKSEGHVNPTSQPRHRQIAGGGTYAARSPDPLPHVFPGLFPLGYSFTPPLWSSAAR